jgi:hypothetical protein
MLFCFISIISTTDCADETDNRLQKYWSLIFGSVMIADVRKFAIPKGLLYKAHD